ncbi:MAG: 50S ribosomal protein L15 [Pirellulaceae bacterium]
MELHEVNSGIKKFKAARRVGRGPGSGRGKTSSRGHKGAKSRAGYSRHPVFQGGAMPLVRQVPKRGFNNKSGCNVVSVNIGDLEQRFEAGEEVTSETLRAKGLAKRRYDELKILGDGELTKKLKVSAHRFSAGAKEKIEKAGGECNVIVRRVPVEDKKKAAKEAKAAAKAAAKQ